jgi:hypothetical protein
MPKKKQETDLDEITNEDIFVGGEPVEDDLSEVDLSAEADRGDDLSEAEAAISDDSDEELSAQASENTEDESEDQEAEPEAAAEADSEEDALEASDESGDEAEDDEEVDGQRETMVPRDRFDQVNERMKLAEQQLREREEREARGEEEAPPTIEFDFDAKEQEYMELVTDGEFEKAKAVRAEIRSAEKEEYEQMAQYQQRNNVTQVNQQIEFDRTVQSLNVEFDTYNPESEQYDQVMVDEVLARQGMFLERGQTPAQALDSAAREVALLYDIPSNYEAELDADPEPAPAPAPRKADVKKKVQQQRAQPPTMDAGSPGGNENKSPTNMSDAEFEALPEATKARMRGDIA